MNIHFLSVWSLKTIHKIHLSKGVETQTKNTDIIMDVFQVMQWSLQHIQSPRWCFHFQKCAGSPSLLRRHWFLPVYQRHKQTRLQRSAPCRVWRPRPVAPLWEGMMVRARLRMASPSLPCPRTRSVVHWFSSFHVSVPNQNLFLYCYFSKTATEDVILQWLYS